MSTAANPTTIKSASKREHIKDRISHWVRSQGLACGDRILSENQMARMFAVSPLTVRRALAELVGDGLIHRIKGKGTFVGPRPGHADDLHVCLLMPGHCFDLGYQEWHVTKAVLYAFMQSMSGMGSFATRVVDPDKGLPDAPHMFAHYDVVFYRGPLVGSLEEQLRRRCKNLVMFDDRQQCSVGLNVSCSRQESTRRLVAHLAEHGCRRIAYIGTGREADEKWLGYCQALSQFGLELDERLVVRGIRNHDDGGRGASILLSRRRKFDAIFIDADRKAVGVIDYLGSRGINVPQDVAVGAYDALDLYHYGPPFLTSIRPPFQEMVKAALNMVRENQGRQASSLHTIELEGQVVIGRTCGCGTAAEQPAETM